MFENFIAVIILAKTIASKKIEIYTFFGWFY